MISMIAAIGRNREIGKDNQLLWDIPEDMRFFRDTTRGKPVIMGRKTHESIGRPLPKRTNIILSRNPEYHSDGCITASSIEEAIQIASKEDSDESFIIGGANIYEKALDKADRLYLTLIDASFDADSFFPDYSDFKKLISKRDSKDNNFNYSFVTLER